MVAISQGICDSLCHLNLSIAGGSTNSFYRRIERFSHLCR
jgi:hypothetical protein